ncbi:exodeoxyribonuclease VII large subunit [Porphyrobacter sp. GA68]|uniref:exodeoxyribonuclease VII large subunit n=1 Tax=Porphyrobacter sp. GA68 TaxID=2883480 RepID=UPI001D189C89|nr:exodeoxyribonuclease VII large subunit [Porphyrobacter sp. GA68]
MPASFNDDDDAGRLVAKQHPGDNAEPLSISEVSSLIKRTMEDRFGFVRLRGELSGVKRAASGHLYCALKDDKAVIDGVMWRGSAARLAFGPEDGLEVIASGKVTTYPGRSKYQIVIDSMELAGEGALLALLERTRARLEAEGLFARERKRALPYLPRVIGVVTSPTGAVIRDILHRLADRFPTEVLLWPVLVQGPDAARQVAAAVRGFGELTPGGAVPRPDLLIVARGGGSIEDLWSFNEEEVVRAVAASSIPVISAVGHETDTSLCDFAADRRAPTPTAAAEMAVPVKAELQALLADFAARTRRAAVRPVTLGQERLLARVQRLPRVEALLQPQALRLDEVADRLRRALQDRARTAGEQLQRYGGRLSLPLLQQQIASRQATLRRIALRPQLLERIGRGAEQRLDAAARIYRSLDPKAPLKRGFVLVRAANGDVVLRKAIAEREERLQIEFADGSLDVVPAALAAKAPRKRAGSPSARQDDLFGAP